VFDVLVAVFFGIKTVTGLVERADTVVLSGVLDVIERVVRAVVALFWLRDTAFPSREAAPALNTQTRNAQTKSKNFFISRYILSNL
jgi:hypothetical protein